ncbi:hypothetical protein [Kitasatospora sp. NPDC091207]|uniref:hypothetical protein n=1 Tax=Kitasatospora sp. NPDC091207 TaxID=3364083 RepID=UPI00382C9B15
MTDATGPEPQPLGICLVANVAQETSHGEGGLEIHQGLRHFAPEAKVWIAPPAWGDGGESVIVAGRPEIVLTVKNCPECRDDFTCHPSIRQVYCSPRCRKDAELRRELQRDQQRAARLGESSRTRPETSTRTEMSPPRSTQRQPPQKRDPLEPAATRNCPPCDQPITIVALLATPEAARPVIHPRSADLPALRRVP